MDMLPWHVRGGQLLNHHAQTRSGCGSQAGRVWGLEFEHWTCAPGHAGEGDCQAARVQSRAVARRDLRPLQVVKEIPAAAAAAHHSSSGSSPTHAT